MHFDDRLATVLQHRPAGERAARVQFRQLLDLLGEPAEGSDRELTRAAFRRLDSLALAIPAEQRERLAGECSPRIRNPLLLGWFAGAEPRVALAALSRATLSEAQWLELIPDMPIGARGLLRHRRTLPRSAHDLLDRLGVRDRVLPEPRGQAHEPGDASPGSAADHAPALDLGRYEAEDYVLVGPDAPPVGRPMETGEASGNLGALVRRIEEFQRARERRGSAADTPRLPLGEEADGDVDEPALGGFLFSTDEMGRIDWAEGSVAPLVVGTLLTVTGEESAAEPARAFTARRPITGWARRIDGAAAIAGEWIVDAAPRFTPRGGRFRGYVGRFRRPAPPAPDMRGARAFDRVRQLLHELRTPVSAIQGFAEVIQQQTVGPVPHEYRAIAAGIAGDAARMLAGFAEIERLAVLEAGTPLLVEGTSDFTAIARRQVDQLRTVLSPRVSRIEASFAGAPALVPMGSESAETIAWRFLGTLASTVAAGETLVLSLDVTGESLRLTARLPNALAGVADVFAADIQPGGGGLGVGLLGAGFALRLARAEARAAGGDLAREQAATMVLTLPLAGRKPAPDGKHGEESAPAAEAGVRAPLAQSLRAR